MSSPSSIPSLCSCALVAVKRSVLKECLDNPYFCLDHRSGSRLLQACPKPEDYAGPHVVADWGNVLRHRMQQRGFRLSVGPKPGVDNCLLFTLSLDVPAEKGADGFDALKYGLEFHPILGHLLRTSPWRDFVTGPRDGSGGKELTCSFLFSQNRFALIQRLDEICRDLERWIEEGVNAVVPYVREKKRGRTISYSFSHHKKDGAH